MAADNNDLLALMGDVLRAVDRQTAENKKSIEGLSNQVEQLGNTVEQLGNTAVASANRFEAIFNRFAEATADGFIRTGNKLDAVKQEVSGLRTDVQQIDQRLARVEANQATQADMLHRLEVLESIVLRKAS